MAGSTQSSSSQNDVSQSAKRGSDETIFDQSQRFAPSQGRESAPAPAGDAFDVLRGTVVGALDSVVREYEPQIATFASNIAHEAVDRGVAFAQTAAQRIQKQSWLRLGLAAALGVGIVAVLAYEVADGAEPRSRARRPTH